MKKAFRWISFVFMISLLAIALKHIINNSDLSLATTNVSNINTDADFEVHFLDVGQGDSILIKCNDESMLIDAGDNDKGTFVQNYLQKQNIKTLKYVVGTHPDADHIGGLDVVLYKFDCKHILMPPKEHTTATYRDVIDTIHQKGYTLEYPQLGQSFMLGDAVCHIVGPVNYYEDNNNNSISILVQYGDNRFLFMGDTEIDGENDILNMNLNINADVIKLGHHGSRTSSQENFLTKVSPDICVISCGVGNKYGHPHTETLNTLSKMNVSLFRTDMQGTIIMTSDGSTISVNTAPAVIAESITQEESQVREYILNTRSKKIHLPSCDSVQNMSAKNRENITTSKDELIKQGYTPCNSCKP